MRVFARTTPTPEEVTPVVLGAGPMITLGVRGSATLRRPREFSRHPVRRTRPDFISITGVSLHAVTSYHVLTSPGSGAVARAVMKLTCSAISNPGSQGGEKPMSLAPELR
jgi:hypothetical protein